VWTANPLGPQGTVSRIDPDNGTTNNFTTGGNPLGILFDGTNLWVTDQRDNRLIKLDSNGNILQSIPVGGLPQFPVFDGSNIWVPNYSGPSVTVVRARDGQVMATLTENGLNAPVHAAFDGQRILVTNVNGNSLSLWNATDLTPIGSVSTGGTPPGRACSDGINFWITLGDTNQLARF
jgi:DNA-binding beta-propeller fold protein YncE